MHQVGCPLVQGRDGEVTTEFCCATHLHDFAQKLFAMDAWGFQFLLSR